jgi:hypothetical protein
LVGLQVNDAHELALVNRVATVTADPDAPPPLSGTVVAQHPIAGTQVLPGDTVTIWIDDDDDGNGDDGNGDDGGGGSAPTPTGPPPLDPAGTKPGS